MAETESSLWLSWVYYALYAVGLVGNTLSVAVWSVLLSRGVKGVWFLVVLSLSDLLAIIVGIVHIALTSSQACSAAFFLYLQDYFYYYSLYLTVAIVVQRYLSVAYPTKVVSLCSKLRQVLTVVVLLPVALAVSAGGLKLNIDSYNICLAHSSEYGETEMMCSDRHNVTDVLDRICTGEFGPSMQDMICTHENATEIIEQVCTGQAGIHDLEYGMYDYEDLYGIYDGDYMTGGDTSEHISNVQNGGANSDGNSTPVYVSNVYGEDGLDPAMTAFVAFTEKWLYAQIVVGFLPLSLLVVFNVLLLRKLRTSATFTSSSSTATKSPTSTQRGNQRMKRASRQLTLVALWISITSIVVYVVVMASHFYFLSAVHSIYVEHDPHAHDTATAFVHVRDVSVAATISINFLFYACLCQSFRDVLARRWRLLKGGVLAATSSSSASSGETGALTVCTTEERGADASTAVTSEGQEGGISMSMMRSVEGEDNASAAVTSEF